MTWQYKLNKESRRSRKAKLLANFYIRIKMKSCVQIIFFNQIYLKFNEKITANALKVTINLCQK